MRNSPLEHIYQLPDLDDAVAHWTYTVYNVFDKHVPVIEVRVKNQGKSLSVINSDVLETIGERDAAQKYHLP